MSKNVILVDENGEQLAVATTAEQVAIGDGTNVKQKIDSLIQAGTSTEGNAELIDARISYDGVTYDSAGTAIRTQARELDNKKLDKYKPTKQVNTVRDRFFYDNNGTLAFAEISDGGYASVERVVNPGDVFYLTFKSRNRANDRAMVLYSDGGKYNVSQIIGTDCVTSIEQEYSDYKIVVPSGATYMAVNFNKADGLLMTKEEIFDAVETAYVDDGDAKLDWKYSSVVSRTRAFVDLNALTTGKRVINWGSTDGFDIANEDTYLYSSTDGVYTAPYMCAKGEILKSANQMKALKGFQAYFFNLDGSYNSTVVDTIATVPCDGYVVFDWANADLVPEAIVTVGSADETPEVLPYYHQNYVYAPSMADEKPLDVIDKTGGYMAIFHDFATIGDSLAIGCMEGYDSTGTYRYIDNFDYAWGKCIERATGCTWHRMSRGGQYVHDDNWFNEWSEKVKTELCTAYILNIGFNDSGWLDEDSSRLGSLDDIKSDFTQNPNTFYGMYAKIIQLILSVQPKAKIFLCNMEWNSTDNGSLNSAIEDICNHFNSNCYLIDLKTYAHEPYWYVKNVLKTGLYHKNTLGYQKTAWDIMSYVDYIVRHNMEDFVDVQFIGTEYYI